MSTVYFLERLPFLGFICRFRTFRNNVRATFTPYVVTHTPYRTQHRPYFQPFLLLQLLSHVPLSVGNLFPILVAKVHTCVSY